jgi:transposase
MMERYLTQAHARLKKLPRQSLDAIDDRAAIVTPRRVPHARTENERQRSQSSRDARLVLYKRVQELRNEGRSVRSISEHLRLNRATVRKFYYAESFPERSQRKLMPSILDPYLSYLEERHREGCQNASQLWREISQQGYPGTRSQVYKWVQQKRQQPAVTTPKKYLTQTELAEKPRQQNRWRAPYVPSVKELTWLFTKSEDTLTKREHHILEWLQQDKIVSRLYDLVQQFAVMIRRRQAEAFDDWLTACARSGISCLLTFSSGIQQEYSAVRASLETRWSNGQTEGQVNRLKLLKRQMYGRASFDLLRLKALHTA